MDYLIKTERLHLRPPVAGDSSKMYAIMKDEKLTKFLTWNHHENELTTKGLLKNLINAHKEGRGYHWCVCVDEEVVGLISLIDVRRIIRLWTINRAELSYLIGSKYQGKGYATEASRAIRDFGLEELKLHKIIVAHSNKNVESKKICQKLGFVQYAHEHDAFCKNGQWHDLIWYEYFSK